MSADLFGPVLRREAPDVTPTADDPLGQRKPTPDDVLRSLGTLRREVYEAREQDVEKFHASQERVTALERRVETLERLVRLLERVTSHEPIWLPAAPPPPDWNPERSPATPWPGLSPIITYGPVVAGRAGDSFAGVVRDLQNVTAGQEHA